MVAVLASPALAGEVVVEVGEHEGLYRVSGAFSVPAPPAVAWQVLTDYDHIGSFVGSMRSSAVEWREGGHLLLHQTLSGGFFPFRRTMRVALEVREDPEREIAFQDVLARDFLHYAGTWTLAPDSIGTFVAYTLEADPRGALPSVVGRGMMTRSVHDLLSQVQAEIQRRARHAAGGATNTAP